MMGWSRRLEKTSKQNSRKLLRTKRGRSEETQDGYWCQKISRRLCPQTLLQDEGNSIRAVNGY